MEEEREGEKNKWLAFNSKVCTLFGTVIVIVFVNLCTK